MKPEQESLERCLRDCGFDEKVSLQCMKCVRNECKADLLCLLNRQRKKLMDQLHAAQRNVDILDYMIRAVESGEAWMGEESSPTSDDSAAKGEETQTEV